MIGTTMSVRKLLATVGVLVAVFCQASPALAVRIRDVARFRGELPSEITGMGIVVGLKGTGDGGDCLPAVRPLKQMLTRFENPVLLEKELKDVNNVAVVTVSVTIPPRGVNAGDKLDVRISSVFKAKSLKGGRLFWCPMINPMEAEPTQKDREEGRGAKTIYAIASGSLIIDDEAMPTQASIKDGAVALRDWQPQYVANGEVWLSLRPMVASAELATAIADQVNEDLAPQTEGKAVATALDSGSVRIKVPAAEADKPMAFIARVSSLPLPALPGPAKVLINTRSKTIIFTDEVELSPTMISHGSLTITVGGTSAAGTGPSFITLDAHKQGAAKLKDLEAAFNMLRVAADDRIAIVRMLYNAGALKCELQVE